MLQNDCGSMFGLGEAGFRWSSGTVLRASDGQILANKIANLEYCPVDSSDQAEEPIFSNRCIGWRLAQPLARRRPAWEAKSKAR